MLRVWTKKRDCLRDFYNYSLFPGQLRQVKRTLQDSINELIIRKMNPLVVAVTSVKIKAAFLHA